MSESLDRFSAWLIERGQPEKQAPTVWWVMDDRSLDEPTSRDGEKWTQDALEATQFATQAAAEAVIDRLFTGPLGYTHARATEHVFG